MTISEEANSAPHSLDGWPPYLFKYRPLRSEEDLNRAKRILDGYLYAAHRSKFNDPFDCAPVLKVTSNKRVIDHHIKALVGEKFVGRPRSDKRRFLKGAFKTSKRLGIDTIAQRSLDQTLDESAIISMTAKPDDLLMWAHYGSEHTGICFQFSLLDKRSAFRRALPVNYENDRPVLRYPIDNRGEMLNALFLNKAKCWKYENEWRIIAEDGYGEKSFLPERPSGIIFGALSSKAHIKSIVDYLRNTVDHSVELYQVQLDKKEYRLIVKTI